MEKIWSRPVNCVPISRGTDHNQQHAGQDAWCLPTWVSPGGWEFGIIAQLFSQFLENLNGLLN